MESRIRDEISEHPELGDEDSSRNGGSTAPTTNNGTPAPKLKLNFNTNSNFANGGSSGQQSDDDDE
jgi:ATP-dependent helicase STH1/SNF2